MERGLVQEHPDFPNGLINPSPVPRQRKPAPQPDNQIVAESTPGEGLVLTLGSTGEDADSAGDEGKPAHERRDPSKEEHDDQDAEEKDDEEEGTVSARVGATLESDPADVLQQG